MNQSLVVSAVFVSLITAMLVAGVPTRVYSFGPSPPSSPSDNNTPNIVTTSNNQSSTTNTTTASQQQQQEMEGFSTYEDPNFGFSIQYPSDWNALTTDLTPLMVDSNTKNPGLAALSTVSFKPNNDTLSAIQIIPLNVAKYLDSNDMKVKNKTPHDYILDTINYMNSGESSKPGLFQTIYKPIKYMATTVGKNYYPAWRLDSSVTAFGNTGYVKQSLQVCIGC